MKNRTLPELSNGAMSDIAFLLLIFFVTTTEIFDEKGFQVVLPHADATSAPARDTEIFHIYINAKDEILAERQVTDIHGLGQLLKEQIESTRLASRQKFVISLHTDRATTYEMFIRVHEQIRVIYRATWEEIALQDYQKSFQALSDAEKNQVRNTFPLVISES